MSKRVSTKTKPAETLFGELPPQPQPVVPANATASAKPPGRALKTADVVAVDPNNMLAVIAAAAANPKVDVGKMQALLSMQKEIMAEQARITFIEAFRDLKRDLPVINRDGCIVIVAKDATGKRPESGGRVQQRTPYATFENISQVIDPLLDRHGFTLSFATEPTPDGSRLLVRGILSHVRGHERVTVFPLPAETSGSKNNAQGWGSSFSYGKRYATVALLNIRTAAPEDRDTDGNPPKRTKGGKPQTVDGDVVVDGGVVSSPVCTVEQLDKIREAIETCGVPVKTFCEHFEIETTAQLKQSDYQAALDACRSYADRRRK